MHQTRYSSGFVPLAAISKRSTHGGTTTASTDAPQSRAHTSALTTIQHGTDRAVQSAGCGGSAVQAWTFPTPSSRTKTAVPLRRPGDPSSQEASVVRRLGRCPRWLCRQHSRCPRPCLPPATQDVVVEMMIHKLNPERQFDFVPSKPLSISSNTKQSSSSQNYGTMETSSHQPYPEYQRRKWSGGLNWHNNFTSSR